MARRDASGLPRVNGPLSKEHKLISMLRNRSTQRINLGRVYPVIASEPLPPRSGGGSPAKGSCARVIL